MIWERQSAKSATFCTFAILTSQIEQKRRTRMPKRVAPFPEGAAESPRDLDVILAPSPEGAAESPRDLDVIL